MRTGAQDDLQRATDLCRHMVIRYGMNEKLGLTAFEAPRHGVFLTPYPVGEREYSEETARTIDGGIQQLMEMAHVRVRQTLTAKRAVLDALAALPGAGHRGDSTRRKW